MGRSRARFRVWWMSCVAMLAMATSASSQQLYEATRQSLDLSPDILYRSPRLLGMGRLTLADDLHNRITLWEFADNPNGVMDADTNSTLELWPSTATRSGIHSEGARLREYVAAREARIGYEAWKRAAGSSTYGFSGDFASLRVDRPFRDEIGLTGDFQVPSIVAVLNGRMPYLQGDHMRYSIRGIYEYESDKDQYRTIISNPAGEFISKGGPLRSPPDFFTPDQRTVSTLGGGAGLSYRFGSWLTAATNIDGLSQRIEGTNEDARYSSGTGEDRPFIVGQGTLIGRVGNHFEWGGDARVWRSDSREGWVFTLAGGIGQEPFSGRGLRLTRSEEGSTMRSRVRLVLDALELGASFRTGYRQVVIQAPDPDDRTSFNYFRNTATYRSNLDSLALPDSVSDLTSEQRAFDAAVGGSWRFGAHGSIGAEVHNYRDRLDQTSSGEGPVRKGWDARTGLEYACTEVLLGRLGYVYRHDDRDDLTTGNEFVSQTITAGAGLKPSGTSWTFDLGYAFEWIDPDYGDPTEARETRQQALAQVRWSF